MSSPEALSINLTKIVVAIKVLLDGAGVPNCVAQFILNTDNISITTGNDGVATQDLFVLPPGSKQNHKHPTSKVTNEAVRIVVSGPSFVHQPGIPTPPGFSTDFNFPKGLDGDMNLVINLRN